MERVVIGHYWVVWGHAVRKKAGGDGQSGAKWVQTKALT